GRPLRGAEDLESAPAFHDVGRSERSRHPMSEGVGSLAGACDEPQAPSVEQMRRRFADDPIHDAATGANGRVANDVVERDARHGPEHERVTPDLEANLLRATPRFRARRKVVLAHSDGRTMDPA